MMFKSKILTYSLIAATCTFLAGCASPKPVAYKGITSSSYLTPNTRDKSEKVPYSYETSGNWQDYTNIIVDQVAIYRGPDNQFEEISEDDKLSLAHYMYAQFTGKLSARFNIVSSPGPNTLRLKLTLTGITKTTPVLGTVSRFDLMGALYNGVQSLRGGEGSFTGSVIYAAEIYDASKSKLLSAYIVKQYPNSLNIGASIGALAAARTGIEKGAEMMVEQLR